MVDVFRFLYPLLQSITYAFFGRSWYGSRRTDRKIAGCTPKDSAQFLVGDGILECIERSGMMLDEMVSDLLKCLYARRGLGDSDHKDCQ